jgi:chorismate mutase
MAESQSPNEKKIVEVGINQQQHVVIERLRAEKQFGTADGEIIRNVFREFVKQEGR